MCQGYIGMTENKTIAFKGQQLIKYVFFVFRPFLQECSLIKCIRVSMETWPSLITACYVAVRF